MSCYTCDLPGCNETFLLDGTGWSFTTTSFSAPEQKVRFCSLGHLEHYRMLEREYLEKQRAEENVALQAAGAE